MLAMIQPRHCRVRPGKTGGYWLLRLILLLQKGSHAPSPIGLQQRRLTDTVSSAPPAARPFDCRVGRQFLYHYCCRAGIGRMFAVFQPLGVFTMS